VKLLLEKGANIDAKTNQGFTALMVASYKGQAEAVKLLLDKGANLEAKGYNGWTALIWRPCQTGPRL